MENIFHVLSLKIMNHYLFQEDLHMDILPYRLYIINYKVDNYYNPDFEKGIPYDDKELNIDWGIKRNKLIVSEKIKIKKPFDW